jgi:hypothetical protein
LKKRIPVILALSAVLIAGNLSASEREDPKRDLTTRVMRFIKHLLPPYVASPKDDYPGPPKP